ETKPPFTHNPAGSAAASDVLPLARPARIRSRGWGWLRGEPGRAARVVKRSERERLVDLGAREIQVESRPRGEAEEARAHAEPERSPAQRVRVGGPRAMRPLQLRRGTEPARLPLGRFEVLRRTPEQGRVG